MKQIITSGIAFLMCIMNCSAVVYTHNQCLDGTATASTEYSAIHIAERAFDGVFSDANYNGWFTSSGLTNGWLAYEFTEPKTIIKYSIFNRDYSTADNSAPRDWKLEAWDGSQWVELDEQLGQTGWVAAERRDYEFTNTVAYTEYRINITENNGSTFMGFAELEMYAEANFIGDGGPESVWHFGFGAGLDFRYDPPLALQGSNMSQWEGCASISDAAGDLLFYTNGLYVWDANHNFMSNGTGLYGSPSSSQSAVVVPQPGSTTNYYLFTLDRNGDYESGYKGLCYSVVDMSLNGGLGDVISGQKNIELNNPNTEKITAVNHDNGEDIWVLTHDWGNNKFLAYLLSSSGLNTTPVESETGLVHYDNFNGWYAGGYMKVSPNGDKIALNILGAHTTQVFDFNPATGIVSNPMTLSTTRNQAYGLEFSPDASKLYTTAWEHNNILQYDLSLSDETSIAASEMEIGVSAVSGGSNYSGLGALQLGPDGRIYVAKDANGINNNINELNGYLGYIENPNDDFGGKANVNYVDKGVYLGGNASGIGLPVYVQTYFKPLPVELLYFTAKHIDDFQVMLSWETASEINSEYFVLQKADESMEFQQVFKCKAQGNSFQINTYDFADSISEKTYYRLLQYDLNGAMHNLGIISISSILTDFQTEVFPNPFQDKINIRFNTKQAGKYLCQIFEESGKLLVDKWIQLEKGQSVIQISCPEKSLHVLFLQISDESNQEKTVHSLYRY
ncbi:MAG: hypothetical protein PF448_10730 [Bacteroidales bacterium]|jgi:hypothetical protein|nr:hypothetical protein [Bacteroidales bacterium]